MATGTGWTIGRKLMASFMLVSGITAILGGVGFYAVYSGAQSIDEIGEVRLHSVDSLLTIKSNAENIRALAIPGLPAEARQSQYDLLASAREEYEAAWKVYEPLPQTAEEAALWNQFVPAWEAWRAENNRFVEVCRQIDGNGIADPGDLARHLEQFTKDHYALVQRVLHLLHMENADFEGGDDHAACNAGRWLPTFKTDNQQLNALLRDFDAPHRRFHEGVGKIKTLVAQGQREEAQQVYRTEMVVNMEHVFKDFEAMLAMANESNDLFASAESQLLGPLAQSQDAAIALLDQIVQLNRDLAHAEVEQVRGGVAGRSDCGRGGRDGPRGAHHPGHQSEPDPDRLPTRGGRRPGQRRGVPGLDRLAATG